jgi:hypothetical protein
MACSLVVYRLPDTHSTHDGLPHDGLCVQHALAEEGFYCGEDDEEVFFFGDSTQSAVFSFQACKHILETGIVDEQTWQALQIGSGGRNLEGHTSNVSASVGTGTASLSETGCGGADKAALTNQPFRGLFEGILQVGQDGVTRSGSAQASQTLHCQGRYTKWPVLREGDGNRAVHTLQVRFSSDLAEKRVCLTDATGLPH